MVAAAATAAAMIAFQVGAKATRDAFFLSIFPITLLPAMMAATSALAVALAFLATRLLSRWGPNRVIPAACAGSGLLLLGEWAIAFTSPPAAAILLYLHYGCLGALLVSGFWSLVNERFDPRTAKRELGGILASGTVGGLAGGLIAAQVGRLWPVTAMLPILACCHLVSALCVAPLRAVGSATGSTRSESNREPINVRTVARAPYIRGLIILVLLTTISEGLLDLVLKSRAADALGKGGALLQFFAGFYVAVSLLTAIVQWAASRVALTRLGPARTAALLPAGTAVATLGATLVPGFPTVVAARGIQSVLSNSLFRGGYEILFTPVPAREKRAVKALADVGASRAGDLGAAAIAQVVLLAPMAGRAQMLLVISLVLSLLALYVALRLHGGYVQTLARGLVSRVVQLGSSELEDSLTRLTALQTLGPEALGQIREWVAAGANATPAPTPDPEPPAGAVYTQVVPATGQETDEERRFRALRSADPAQVIRALQDGPPPTSLVPLVVRLLGWDEVAREAIAALRALPEPGPAIEAMLLHFLDPHEDFTIRRRIPLVLATYGTPRAFEGLLGGLEDQRFEVRYRSGRGLAHMLDLDPSLAVPREKVLAVVIREVEVGAGVWESRKLEQMDDEGWSPVVDELLRDRANRSLEHVFTLLALVMPKDPLRIAFKALHTDDPHLRGTALEYLESSLPPEIRRPLWPYLEDNRPRRAAPARSQEEVIQDLLQSNVSIIVKLEELQQQGSQGRGVPARGRPLGGSKEGS